MISILKKIFVREPEDYLTKGDNFFVAHSFYEARTTFEAGLRSCRGKTECAGIANKLEERIYETNRSMAVLNMNEAEHSINCGNLDKAVEHLELALTLTDDVKILTQVKQMLNGLEKESTNITSLSTGSSCTSCSQSSFNLDEGVSSENDSDLPVLEYYNLLIHQIPEEMYECYASLGEDFACMYIAASRDSHQEALNLLEKWFDGSNRDIYCYEKGKILNRLGLIHESEEFLRESIIENLHNPLPYIALASLLIDENRLEEAACILDSMINSEIYTGQAMMMRGEVYRLGGDINGAIFLYGKMLETSLARAAAEKLHDLLLESNRIPEATHIFNRYLSKCQH